MPFTRPTLSALLDRVRDDFDSRLPGADSRLRRSVLDVIARVHAAATSGLYGFLDWIWRQVFPDTAEAEQLARWAAIWGVARKPATSAVGSVKLLGADGSIADAGALLLRSDGAEFRLVVEAIVAGGEAIVAVAADKPGIGGNAPSGQKLTFAAPVLGVQAVAAVEAGGLIGGGAEEADESLRQRLLARIRRPPHGGNLSDYERWALEVPGVTRAWVYPLALGPGTVSVYFVMDGRVDPIPLAGDIIDVADHLAPLRPVTAAVSVFGPIPVPLDLTIKAVPQTAEVETAITAEIADLLFREAEPGGVVLISHIREAISIAAGEMDHVLISPIGNAAADVGHILVPGMITWAP